MKAGDKAALFSNQGFVRFVTIKQSGVDSGRGKCYTIDNGSFFYMKSEVGTGRMYSVISSKYWLISGALPFDDDDLFMPL